MSFVWADIEVLGARNPTLASSVGTIACVTMSSKAEILRPKTSTAATVLHAMCVGFTVLC